MSSLQGKTLVITGASRGIGRSIAIRAAQDGANVVVAAKTAEKHAKLEGTIFETAEAVEKAGGKALALQVDVREEDQVKAMMATAAETFGGIDILINNAGAISLTPVEYTPLKKYDLMQDINSRAVFMCSQAALPWLKKSSNPHILSLSPPVNLNPRWLKPYAAYALSKYGMTILSLGMAEEFRDAGIAVNTLWPKTYIATAAIEFTVGSRDAFKVCRRPEIMSDAAWHILTSPARELTAQTLIDEDFLRTVGTTDFTDYAWDKSSIDMLAPDLFLDV